MTNAMQPARKRKPQGPFSEELIDQMLSQVQGNNHCNGTSPKTVLTPSGAPQLDIPRDRLSNRVRDIAVGRGQQ